MIFENKCDKKLKLNINVINNEKTYFISCVFYIIIRQFATSTILITKLNRTVRR